MFPERSAFAGKTEEGNKAPFCPSGHFPLWGKYRRSGGGGLYVPLAQNPLPCAPWADKNREHDHEPHKDADIGFQQGRCRH